MSRGQTAYIQSVPQHKWTQNQWDNYQRGWQDATIGRILGQCPSTNMTDESVDAWDAGHTDARNMIRDNPGTIH